MLENNFRAEFAKRNAIGLSWVEAAVVKYQRTLGYRRLRLTNIRGRQPQPCFVVAKVFVLTLNDDDRIQILTIMLRASWIETAQSTHCTWSKRSGRHKWEWRHMINNVTIWVVNVYSVERSFIGLRHGSTEFHRRNITHHTTYTVALT